MHISGNGGSGSGEAVPNKYRFMGAREARASNPEDDVRPPGNVRVPEEVIGNPEKRKQWDEYWAKMRSEWNDSIHDEWRRKNLWRKRT